MPRELHPQGSVLPGISIRFYTHNANLATHTGLTIFYGVATLEFYETTIFHRHLLKHTFKSQIPEARTRKHTYIAI